MAITLPRPLFGRMSNRSPMNDIARPLNSRHVEALAVYHTAFELSRRGWDVLFANERSATKDYDLVATKPGRSLRVEVKGRREGGWDFAWAKGGADVYVFVRLLSDGSIESYVGLVSRVQVDTVTFRPASGRSGAVWSPQKDRPRYLDRWDTLDVADLGGQRPHV